MKSWRSPSYFHDGHGGLSMIRLSVGGTTEETYRRIYRVVGSITEGEVATYGQVAVLAGLPRRARLVGLALAALDDDSGVPWHRVINAQGRISSRDGSPFEHFQRLLLEEEGVELDARGRVDLDRFGWDPLETPG
jgi:methylated-DNA-protein-cysteine methyltransferase-like protein